MKKTKISIVTVCMNAEKTIRYTLESVLNQTYIEFEYIVIDGGSIDNTCGIIEEYLEKFENKRILVKFISARDKGIFDAMNKAVQLADGEWVIFINADDTFNSNNVLENVFNTNESYFGIDVIYGNTVRITGEKSILSKGKPIELMLRNMPFCHQSSFTRIGLIKEMPFDLSYIVSDYNFFLRSYLCGKKFKYIDITIANYSMEGFSNQNKYLTYLETINIKHDLGLINKNRFIQKLKNVYFKNLLTENLFLHKAIFLIDKVVKNRNIYK